jgi:hypothetical protein
MYLLVCSITSIESLAGFRVLFDCVGARGVFSSINETFSRMKKTYKNCNVQITARNRHEHAMSAEYGTKVFLGDVATKVPRAPPTCDAKRLSRAHRPLTGLPTAGLPLGRCLTYNKPGHGAPSVPPKANSNPTAVLLRTSVHSCVRA